MIIMANHIPIPPQEEWRKVPYAKISTEEEEKLGFALDAVSVWYQCRYCYVFLHSIMALKSHSRKVHDLKTIKVPRKLPPGAKEGKIYFDYLPYDWRFKNVSLPRTLGSPVSVARVQPTESNPASSPEFDIRVRNVAEIIEVSDEEDNAVHQNVPEGSLKVDGFRARAISSVTPDLGMFEGGSEINEDEIKQGQAVLTVQETLNKIGERETINNSVSSRLSRNCIPFLTPNTEGGNKHTTSKVMCEICDMQFSTQGVLNFHIRKIHKLQDKLETRHSEKEESVGTAATVTMPTIPLKNAAEVDEQVLVSAEVTKKRKISVRSSKKKNEASESESGSDLPIQRLRRMRHKRRRISSSSVSPESDSSSGGDGYTKKRRRRSCRLAAISRSSIASEPKRASPSRLAEESRISDESENEMSDRDFSSKEWSESTSRGTENSSEDSGEEDGKVGASSPPPVEYNSGDSDDMFDAITVVRKKSKSSSKGKKTEDLSNKSQLHACSVTGCNYTFKTSSDLYHHHNDDHPDKGEPGFVCGFCNLEFPKTRKSSANRHIRSCMKKFNCNIPEETAKNQIKDFLS